MAVKSRTGSSVLKFLQFVVRFLGLNGLIAAAVGLVLYYGLKLEEIGLILMIAGGSAATLALLFEVPGMTSAVASHRGVAGLNVFIQVGLAATLVVGANVYSFDHFKRFDLTDRQIFTLSETLREKLASMRGDTEIIVYVQHVSFGQRVDLRQDDYDQAAERVITDKVVDLVEQFKEIGPRFRVHVLDTQKKSFKDHMDRVTAILTKSAGPELAADMEKTIKASPEDSIFFFSPDTKTLQRLSFNDIYHLDKKASVETRNLVLMEAGVQNFADKVFRIEQKRPRIGFAVVHGFLGQDGTDDLGMVGLKEVLPARDFEGRDIVLWKELQTQAAALESEESRFERAETRQEISRRAIKELEEELKEFQRLKKYWDTTELDQINKDYALALTNRGWALRTQQYIADYRKATGKNPQTIRISEEYKAQMVKEWPDDIEDVEFQLQSKKKQLAKATEELSKLRVENLAEQRRIADVREKFKRLLGDTDLLVVPRWTFRNLVRRDWSIPSRVYPMADAHIDAIKDFIRSGKPVMFLLSPMNDESLDPDETPRPDSLEKMLADFDIQLPRQAILYTSEGEAMEEFRERTSGPGGGRADIPPAVFYWKKSPGARIVGVAEESGLSPLRTSMGITVRSLGEKSTEGLKIRHPRPVYALKTTWPADAVASSIGSLALASLPGSAQALAEFYSKATKKLDEKTVFLMTDTDCWNEDRPVPEGSYVPRFKSPKQGDPDKGTINERRHGPFPIGVAVEADVPREWYDDDPTKERKKVRLAVIGQGGLFVGEKVPPLREKMFVDVANWLLGRETLLAHEGTRETTWQYPRIKLDAEVKTLWEWGARLGLPLVFVCLGMNVWLVRRMR